MTSEGSISASLNRSDKLIGKLFSTNKRYARLWISFENIVGDSLHQVSFPQSRFAVDEEWVVDLSRCLRNCMGGCCSEFVGLADHKMIEGISVTQLSSVRGSILACYWRRTGRGWSDKEIHLGSLLPLFVYPEDNLDRMA